MGSSWDYLRRYPTVGKNLPLIGSATIRPQRTGQQDRCPPRGPVPERSQCWLDEDEHGGFRPCVMTTLREVDLVYTPEIRNLGVRVNGTHFPKSEWSRSYGGCRSRNTAPLCTQR